MHIETEKEKARKYAQRPQPGGGTNQVPGDMAGGETERTTREDQKGEWVGDNTDYRGQGGGLANGHTDQGSVSIAICGVEVAGAKTKIGRVIVDGDSIIHASGSTSADEVTRIARGGSDASAAERECGRCGAASMRATPYITESVEGRLGP
ncbi:unnamed protein product [Prunus armeniaca]|uniref:Uncharacterized protein n=1 Tax=Prunus armeniaca TaxID=36596 RepID=A0A6J5W6U0_PRUAR|nr:unnamed protein product [Prunus armeniaca]